MKNVHKKHITTSRSSKPAILVLTEIINELQQETEQNLIVAIGGPGGSGKSTFAEKLQTKLTEFLPSKTIKLDNYRFPRSQRSPGQLGSNPDSNHIALLKEHLSLIRSGTSFNLPVYDKKTGKADETRQFTPESITIVEGELATNSELAELVDLTIFIDSDWKTQLNSRINRDITSNGQDKEKVIHTFLQSNLKDFQRFGAAGKYAADIHLFSDENYYMSIEAVSEEIYQFHKQLFKGYKEVILDGDVYTMTVTINEQNSADLELFVNQLAEMQKEGVERIIINDCPLASFFLPLSEKLELLTLAEEYFAGVIIYQLTNAPKDYVLNELNALQNHTIDAFTFDLEFFEKHLGVNMLRPFVMDLISNSNVPLFFFEEDFADFCTYFVKSDKMKIAPISKCRK